MQLKRTDIEGLLVIEPDIYRDKRGFFLESFHKEKYKKLGIKRDFVQDNLSFSRKDVLRGLHFQVQRPQAKLVQTIFGEVFDVAVDLRKNSPTFGQWFSIILSGDNMKQMFIPEGFAHGFCVISETALFSYKCSDIFVADDEGGILWSDPDLSISWPCSNPQLSEKDRRMPFLSQLDEGDLPRTAQ